MANPPAWDLEELAVQRKREMVAKFTLNSKYISTFRSITAETFFLQHQKLFLLLNATSSNHSKINLVFPIQKGGKKSSGI